MVLNSDEINKKSQMIKFHPLVWPVVGIIHLKGIVGGFFFFYVISFGYSLEYSTYLGLGREKYPLRLEVGDDW